MLDQNTDRMWFVIGAVIVGAAIIFIANGTMPEIFASVTESFEEASDKATAIVKRVNGPISFEDRLEEVSPYESNGINILHNDTMTALNLPVFDKSQYDTNGTVRIRTRNGHHDGIRMFVSDFKDLEPNTVYTLSYSFRKINGSLIRWGGHVSNDMRPNKAFINGVEMDYSASELDVVRDDTSLQHVVVHFITDDDVTDDIRDERGIWIQPNRNSANMPVEVEIYDLQITKGMDVTPWSAYGQ